MEPGLAEALSCKTEIQTQILVAPKTLLLPLLVGREGPLGHTGHGHHDAGTQQRPLRRPR